MGVVGDRQRPAGQEQAVHILGYQAAIGYLAADLCLPVGQGPNPQRGLVTLVLVIKAVVVVMRLGKGHSIVKAPASHLVGQCELVLTDDLPALAHADQRRDIEHARLFCERLLPVQLDALPPGTRHVHHVQGIDVSGIKVEVPERTVLSVEPARGLRKSVADVVLFATDRERRAGHRGDVAIPGAIDEYLGFIHDEPCWRDGKSAKQLVSRLLLTDRQCRARIG